MGGGGGGGERERERQRERQREREIFFWLVLESMSANQQFFTGAQMAVNL